MQLSKYLPITARIFFIRLLNWEYWNGTLFYLPVLPYLAILWIRSRSCFFFNAANPGIQNGGFIMESKWDMYGQAPRGFFPYTRLMKPGENFTVQYEKIMNSIEFPLIAKPVIGSKGQGVAVIEDVLALYRYHQHCPVDYIVQQKINYPLEAGIFYVRMPGEASGKITGIVEKEFVQVTGNGQLTVLQLLMQNPRYLLQLKSLKQIISPAIMKEVLAPGIKKIVLDIGNHARGAYFINASHRINDRLTISMDAVCRKFPGFYYGRLDIRFESWDQLNKGKGFAIIELNGSGSEPTHIYDPANSIWHAWWEICRHWYCMFAISRHNHREGVSYLSFKQGIQLMRNHVDYTRKLKAFANGISAAGAGNVIATATPDPVAPVQKYAY